jgi:hypothetical protein
MIVIRRHRPIEPTEPAASFALNVTTARSERTLYLRDRLAYVFSYAFFVTVGLWTGSVSLNQPEARVDMPMLAECFEDSRIYVDDFDKGPDHMTGMLCTGVIDTRGFCTFMKEPKKVVPCPIATMHVSPILPVTPGTWRGGVWPATFGGVRTLIVDDTNDGKPVLRWSEPTTPERSPSAVPPPVSDDTNDGMASTTIRRFDHPVDWETLLDPANTRPFTGETYPSAVSPPALYAPPR